MATAAREQDFITEARQHSRNIWEGVYGLKAMQAEWGAGLGATLDDGVGENSGITAADVGAAVFAAADALDQLLSGTLDDQNLPGAQAGNLAKLL